MGSASATKLDRTFKSEIKEHIYKQANKLEKLSSDELYVMRQLYEIKTTHQGKK